MKNFFALLFLFFSLISAARAEVVPNDFYRPPDSLVKVSSVLYDFAEQKARRVYGAGSVIKVPGWTDRYFILTANHISVGQDLLVETNLGARWPIKNIFHSTDADLTLLEIDADLAPRVSVMAVYKSGVLVTAFDHINYSIDNSQGAFSWITCLAQSFRFPAVEIDGLKSYESLEGPAVALQPPWMAKPEKSMVVYGDKIMKNWIGKIPREQTLTHIRSFQAFPRGYSGAPILIPHGGSIDESATFLLSGVLSTSSQEKDGASGMVGPALINRFVEDVSAGKITQNFVAQPWFLVKNGFVTVEKNIVAFLFSGPVGNGIVVEGIIGNDSKSDARAVFSRSMVEKGISESSLSGLVSKIDLIKKEQQQLENTNDPARRQLILTRIEGLKAGPFIIR